MYGTDIAGKGVHKVARHETSAHQHERLTVCLHELKRRISEKAAIEIIVEQIERGVSMFKLFRRRTSPVAQGWERQANAPRLSATTVAGRRHLTGVPYALPKDTSEIHRLDFQHYIYRNILRGNFLVPVQNPGAILDVACGSGIWGKELAHQFPHSRIVGFDLEESTISGPLPENYQFVKGNLLDGLPFRDNQFDFVHQRLVLASAVPFSRWIEVLRELLRVTCPGGWLELPEVGVEVHPLGPLTRQFFDWGIDASLSRGLYPREIPHLERYLAEAGGRNVGMRSIDVPMGAWGGRIGIMMERNLISALGGLKALYTGQGASAAEFDDLLNQLPGEWRTLRSSLRFFVFWCQK
jgi:ubiquinone/menaquinone biosynthesis C-methylase UbiE